MITGALKVILVLLLLLLEQVNDEIQLQGLTKEEVALLLLTLPDFITLEVRHSRAGQSLSRDDDDDDDDDEDMMMII